MPGYDLWKLESAGAWWDCFWGNFLHLRTQSRVAEKAKAVVAHPAIKNGLRMFAPATVIRSAVLSFLDRPFRVYQYPRYKEHAAWSSCCCIEVDVGKPRLSKEPIAWLQELVKLIRQSRMKFGHKMNIQNQTAAPRSGKIQYGKFLYVRFAGFSVNRCSLSDGILVIR